MSPTRSPQKGKLSIISPNGKTLVPSKATSPSRHLVVLPTMTTPTSRNKLKNISQKGHVSSNHSPVFPIAKKFFKNGYPITNKGAPKAKILAAAMPKNGSAMPKKSCLVSNEKPLPGNLSDQNYLYATSKITNRLYGSPVRRNPVCSALNQDDTNQYTCKKDEMWMRPTLNQCNANSRWEKTFNQNDDASNCQLSDEEYEWDSDAWQSRGGNEWNMSDRLNVTNGSTIIPTLNYIIATTMDVIRGLVEGSYKFSVWLWGWIVAILYMKLSAWKSKRVLWHYWTDLWRLYKVMRGLEELVARESSSRLLDSNLEAFAGKPRKHSSNFNLVESRFSLHEPQIENFYHNGVRRFEKAKSALEQAKDLYLDFHQKLFESNLECGCITIWNADTSEWTSESIQINKVVVALRSARDLQIAAKFSQKKSGTLQRLRDLVEISNSTSSFTNNTADATNFLKPPSPDPKTIRKYLIESLNTFHREMTVEGLWAELETSTNRSENSFGTSGAGQISSSIGKGQGRSRPIPSDARKAAKRNSKNHIKAKDSGSENEEKAERFESPDQNVNAKNSSVFRFFRDYGSVAEGVTGGMRNFTSGLRNLKAGGKARPRSNSTSLGAKYNPIFDDDSVSVDFEADEDDDYHEWNHRPSPPKKEWNQVPSPPKTKTKPKTNGKGASGKNEKITSLVRAGIKKVESELGEYDRHVQAMSGGSRNKLSDSKPGLKPMIVTSPTASSRKKVTFEGKNVKKEAQPESIASKLRRLEKMANPANRSEAQEMRKKEEMWKEDRVGSAKKAEVLSKDQSTTTKQVSETNFIPQDHLSSPSSTTKSINPLRVLLDHAQKDAENFENFAKTSFSEFKGTVVSSNDENCDHYVDDEQLDYGLCDQDIDDGVCDQDIDDGVCDQDIDDGICDESIKDNGRVDPYHDYEDEEYDHEHKDYDRESDEQYNREVSREVDQHHDGEHNKTLNTISSDRMIESNSSTIFSDELFSENSGFIIDPTIDNREVVIKNKSRELLGKLPITDAHRFKTLPTINNVSNNFGNEGTNNMDIISLSHSSRDISEYILTKRQNMSSGKSPNRSTLTKRHHSSCTRQTMWMRIEPDQKKENKQNYVEDDVDADCSDVRADCSKRQAYDDVSNQDVYNHQSADLLSELPSAFLESDNALETQRDISVSEKVERLETQREMKSVRGLENRVHTKSTSRDVESDSLKLSTSDASSVKKTPNPPRQTSETTKDVKKHIKNVVHTQDVQTVPTLQRENEGRQSATARGDRPGNRAAPNFQDHESNHSFGDQSENNHSENKSSTSNTIGKFLKQTGGVGSAPSEGNLNYSVANAAIPPVDVCNQSVISESVESFISSAGIGTKPRFTFPNNLQGTPDVSSKSTSNIEAVRPGIVDPHDNFYVLSENRPRERASLPVESASISAASNAVSISSTTPPNSIGGGVHSAPKKTNPNAAKEEYYYRQMLEESRNLEESMSKFIEF